MARSASDAEVSQGFLSIAKVYRSQAEVLKAKKKAGKKRRWPKVAYFQMAFPTCFWWGSIYSQVAGLDRVGATHGGCTDSP